jgi:hypothetical protein
MTYDDAGWHRDSVAELDLPESAAGTHIGMFMVWLVLHGLVTEEQRVSVRGLFDRSITPGEYLFEACCGEINSAMLNETGDAFTKAAYDTYGEAYESLPSDAAYHSSYAVPDSWETYDLISPSIDRLFAQWRSMLGG